MEIFLNKYKSKRGKNVNSSLTVNLNGSKKLLPLEPIQDSIDELEVYYNERSACTNVRLTCNVNVIASNLLFNSVTEIVKDEGSEDVRLYNVSGITEEERSKVLAKKWYAFDSSLSSRNIPSIGNVGNYKLTYEAVRDTQLSSENFGYKYHCGYDIFNNHTLRSTTFKAVCPFTGKSTHYAFNTIEDYLRDADGKQIKFYNDKMRHTDNKPSLLAHVYLDEDVLSYPQSIRNNLIERNGWFGFENVEKFPMYSGKTPYDFSKTINDRKAYDFIDMYPERDLFFFTPKYNKFRQRIEKNWNYCITYPSSSTTNVSFINQDINSLKIFLFDDEALNTNGTNAIKFITVSKHGLKKGDHVNIYNKNVLLIENAEVTNIENDYVFFIFKGTNSIPSTWIQLDDDKNEYEDELGYKYYFSDLDKSKKIVYSTKRKEYKEWFEVEFNGETYSADTIFKEFKVGGTRYPIKEETVYMVDISHEDEPNYVIIEQNEIKEDGSVVINGENYDNVMETIKRTVDINGQTIEPKFRCEGYGDYLKFYTLDRKNVNINEKSQDLSFKRVVNGSECSYYVRIFSRLPNWRFTEKEPTEYELYKDGSDLIEKYQKIDNEFENHIGKLAFSHNIYNDEIAEVVFTDNININGLRDNLGRPLTDIYFTVIKNNAGFREWYGKPCVKQDFGSDNIEFSHCFGKNTCAFRLSKESIIDKSHSNIISINNTIDDKERERGLIVSNFINHRSNNLTNLEGFRRNNEFACVLNDDEIEYNELYSGSTKIYDGDVNFYGDLCCYSKYNCMEDVIQPIEFRFNTAQRELNSGDLLDKYFNTVYWDEIESDDFDGTSSNNFKLEKVGGLIDEDNIPNKIERATQRKEGYCYIPHYKLPIRTFSSDLESAYPIFYGFNRLKIFDNKKNQYMFQMVNRVLLSENQKFELYDKENHLRYNCMVNKLTSLKSFVATVELNKSDLPDSFIMNEINNYKELDELNIKKYKLFVRYDEEIPPYATFVKDGSCRFYWRDILYNGSDKDSDDEVYPFANNALYIEKNINIFVKRQDTDNVGDLWSDLYPYEIESKSMSYEDEEYYGEKEISC